MAGTVLKAVAATRQPVQAFAATSFANQSYAFSDFAATAKQLTSPQPIRMFSATAHSFWPVQT